MTIEYFIFMLVNGLSQGMLLFIIASGLSLIFGVLRVINFAHGSLYMIGAYVAFSISTLLVSGSLYSFLLLLLVVPPLVMLLGFGLEISLFRRVYGGEYLVQLLLTYALVLILDDLVRVIWGGDPRNVARPRTPGRLGRFFGTGAAHLQRLRFAGRPTNCSGSVAVAV